MWGNGLLLRKRWPNPRFQRMTAPFLQLRSVGYECSSRVLAGFDPQWLDLARGVAELPRYPQVMQSLNSG
jgi:hypothetical protein